MSNLVAAIARPQIALLAERASVWNDCHGRLAALLAATPGVSLPHRPQEEEFVQSSIQFSVAGLDAAAFARFLAACRARGVYLKWFGAREAEGYTSASAQWRYLADPHTPPNTEAVLERLCDMRIPLTLGEADCAEVARVIAEELTAARGA
jgi:dTDP-4-amino-4,6-dideoxygalactose transaminase